MKPSRVYEVVSHIVETEWPAFVWGPPGVGKSSIVKEIANDNKKELIDIRASLLDPTDLRGIPTIKQDTAFWCPPSFLPSDPDSEGIIFFDELNAAPPLVQASLYQLTLDGRIGEYVLPKGWKIIAAGNRAEDHSITFRLPSALANRFIHIDYEVDFEDWRKWAVQEEINPIVVSFLSLRQELLFKMDKPEKGFPTPRSWEMVSDILETTKKSPQENQDILIGTIGEGATIEFVSYAEKSLNAEAVRKILENPEKAKLPEKLGDQYALISYISYEAKDSKTLNAAGILINRLNPELGVLLLRNLIQKNPKFSTHKKVVEFVTTHKELIL
jgi:MoxR-like ATPase